MLRRTIFPEGFIFGTATSVCQIEGHSFGGVGKTHGDSFAATPGNVMRAENGTPKSSWYALWDGLGKTP